MKRNSSTTTYIIALLLFFTSTIHSYSHPNTEENVSNFPINFSCVGYGGGGVSFPSVKAVFLVHPSGKDDTRLLQAAIDSIGKLPLNENGFRGALQLSEGQFYISGQLLLNKSGIVIRGASKRKKTTLVATGNSRRTLIEIQPSQPSKFANPIEITDSIVPAGAMTFTVKSMEDLSIGDPILITRPSTKEWISDIGMDKKEGTFADRRGLKWTVGSKNLIWDRIITSIDHSNKRISIDAPITTALEAIYGGGTIQKVTQDEALLNIGLENLELDCNYDLTNPADEEHAWLAIAIDHSQDCWINGITAKHFVSSLVHVGHQGRRISITNCHSKQPISEAAGFRRQSFWIEGQQVMVQNCTSDSGINDFAIGLCAGGPNVFLNCTATNALGASGASESWSSGTLYENVNIEGSDLRLTYDFDRTQGGGWTAVNSVVWNCSANNIDATGPFCAANYLVNADSSLYASQLQKKLGLGANMNNYLSPEIIPKESSQPLHEFKTSDIPFLNKQLEQIIQAVEIVNGRFIKNGKLLWSGIASDPLWKGQTSTNSKVGSSITGFVPGKVGHGLTEDLPWLVNNLLESENCFYNSYPGLWYDRRRDDHTIAKRNNKNVWAPFFEMPWLRSGQGQAWDGLSKFDLTKYNPWYFDRCKEFAELCDHNGILLIYNFYNTHNLLEYLTHWVDYPWRPANNINETGLQDPPTPEPWARAHMGNQFYDPTNPELRKLHHAYIFHTLDVLGNHTNIAFKVGTQYAGPLNFQRFFMETIHEWEVLHDKNVKLVLAAGKNVTDSILADSELASQVDIIDTRYWQYRSEDVSFSSCDKLWAPPGGSNRSFREMVGDAFILQSDYPFPTSEKNMYRLVREYHDQFPQKAIVTAYNDVSPIATLMAGGAQVLMQYNKGSRPGHISFYAFVNNYLSTALTNLTPNDELLENQGENWCMTDAENQTILLYSLKGNSFTFSKNIPHKSYSGIWYDPITERVVPIKDKISVGKGIKIQKPTKHNWMLLLLEA